MVWFRVVFRVGLGLVYVDLGLVYVDLGLV